MGIALLLAGAARGETARSRAEVGGYFRVMARPDLQGGTGTLGYWNLYGRLMNEGPWAALELKVDLLRPTPGSREPWASAHFKIEGGSVMGADAAGGTLAAFRMSQLYVRAGNVLLPEVEWQIGTLDTWMGDLGLYDMKPAQILFETVGISATWRSRDVDLLVGAGDSGFFLRGLDYSPVLTTGALVRWRVVSGHLELGGGGAFYFEPEVPGNPNAPHTTPGIDYADLVRGEVVENWLRDHPGQEDLFYRDRPPEARAASSYKVVFYLGFGGLGPIKWNNLFANTLRRHPDNFVTETYGGREWTLWVTGLTDERYEVNVGNEMQLELWPGRLDAVWGLLYGHDWNEDNEVAAGEDNRVFYSTVLRFQLYLSSTLHLLLEGSVARERSLNGNLFRLAHDSIFRSTGGKADARGLEYGDTDTRETLQLKAGPVLNPTGLGIFARPSLRLLVGLQQSNVHAAFGRNVVDTLDEYNRLAIESRSVYTHVVVGLEAEAWF
ncbi:MAG: hypothetical protein D6729_09380 [Deltaproteobacteria bacterium]|nr:MAG: hypothetical protein D6729_09380 [Deltaproteobacteria bacterium]